MESLAAQASELGRMVVAKAIASPVILIFGALLTICVATRLTSGRSPRALDGGLKTAGVLPYWVPYLGHALWLVFFPEKLVKARYISCFPRYMEVKREPASFRRGRLSSYLRPFY